MDGRFAMIKRFLIKCRNIHIGDILFASSVAKKLKEEHADCEVDYDIDYLQPIELLSNNPYINRVHFKDSRNDYSHVYNLIEDGATLNPYESAVSQFQRMCDIKDFDDTFEIFTSSALDYGVSKSMEELVAINHWQTDVIKVGYQMDWHNKSFLFTEEEYNRAEGGETGNGYGSGKRDTFEIINCLETHPKIILFALGLEDKISKRFPTINSTSKFTFTASLIKNCDYVIGAEGCITNISSALRVPTIISTDYIHQMFGPKGIHWQQHRKNPDVTENRAPFLGPCCYFPLQGHHHLSPYLTDSELGEEILNIITNG